MKNEKITRNTIQRKLVMDAVLHLKNHPTPDEVYAYIHKEHPTISKGTVYRNLNYLVDRKQLLKVAVPDAANRVDHELVPHYHIVCKTCGNVYDVDMPYFAELHQQIADFRGFDVDEHQIIFSGTCPHCKVNV